MGFVQEIYVKLDRAREHLESFDYEVRRYIEDQPYEFTHQFYAEGEGHYELVSRIRIHKHPPLRLSAMFGESLYNIRSALDHMVYQLSIDHVGPGGDLRRVNSLSSSTRTSFAPSISEGR